MNHKTLPSTLAAETRGSRTATQPNGHNENPPILKHWTPNGTVTIGRHKRRPSRNHASAVRQPTSTSHKMLPIVLIAVLSAGPARTRDWPGSCALGGVLALKVGAT